VPSSSSRHPRGYILLAVMLLLAALVLLVAVAQQRAGEESRTANLERSDAQARALAEAGLERTRAYLGGLLEREVDLDRGLDPGLDTDCSMLPSLTGVTSDDHLPPFTDGQRVIAPSSGKAYLRVPARNGEDGAYFVRIDDNDDDAQDSSILVPGTSNNLLGNCLEGPSLGPLRDNPVRDRDGMVWVTVIGVHPGTSLEGDAARSTLRVLVGPGEPTGIIAGGTVRMMGAAHVCGEFGDVVATGSVEGGCLCGVGCSAGQPWNECPEDEACIAQSGGSTCSASSGRATGASVCEAGVAVPAPPRVSAWDVTNAPQNCTAAPCLPFYYLRLESSGARLYGWNYTACQSPRSAPRICSPSECGPCWVLLDAHRTQEPLGIFMSHLDPGARDRMPSLTLSATKAPRVWRADGATGFTSGGPGCDAGDTALYPGSVGFGRMDVRNVTFELLPSPPTAMLPRGVWFVEGDVRLSGIGTPDCGMLNSDLTYTTSIIATGSIIHEAGVMSLRPASPKGFVLLAGRDLTMRGLGSRIHTCGSSAAVMVHEQSELRGDTLLEAQLVAENASTCSPEVFGDAIQMSGSATVSVPVLPPLSAGPPLGVRLQSESTH
jgi:type II secretory pathway pseudopilin PulG